MTMTITHWTDGAAFEGTSSGTAEVTKPCDGRGRGPGGRPDGGTHLGFPQND